MSNNLLLYKKSIKQIASMGRWGVLTCKLRELRSPIMDVHRGWEVIAVQPNKARWNERAGEYVTSFAPRYMIASKYVRNDSNYQRERFTEQLQSFPLHVRQIDWE